ncbi:MAG: hypothetical protein M2R45_04365 [Verrucomicrobia subdivision 3 bacterium]|nr:hypothetical protein [Limisphaerales bacterium]MCS1416070.1 hypothetical protein [Limisphaerales bacterium]
MKWTPADKRRRRFGLLYLIMAGGMLVWGQTILKPYLSGLIYLAYWLSCFILTVLAIVTALLDIWVVRLRQRHQEADAARQVMTLTSKSHHSKRSGPTSRPEKSDTKLTSH